MDASIILGGQPLNVLGAMDAGRAMAETQINLNRQNALAELYRTQGAGIAAGDQNALNALAGMDPMAALGVQDARLGMDQTRLQMDATKQDMQFSAEKMAMLREQTKRETEAALAEQAANLTAEQLAAEQEALSGALSGAAFFYQNKDKAGYDAFLASKGIDPAEFPFEAFPAHAATVEGVLEAYKTFAPPEADKPADEYGRYVAEETAAGRVPLSRIEFSQALKGNGVTQTIRGPDGTETTIQVGGAAGAGGKGFTEAQSKDNVYATRAVGSLAALEPVANALTERSGVVGEALGPLTLGLSRESLQSDSFQLARQAGLEFLATILRKDTGAAVTPSEEEMYGRMFLPQPGDRDAVLAQKKVARARAVEAIKAGMSPAQILAMGNALLATETATGANQPTPDDAPAASKPAPAMDFSTMGLAEIGQVDIGSLTPEQMDALEKRMTELGL